MNKLKHLFFAFIIAANFSSNAQTNSTTNEKLDRILDIAFLSNTEFQQMVEVSGMSFSVDNSTNHLSGTSKDGAWMFSKKIVKGANDADLIYSNKQNEDVNLLKGAVFVESQLGPNKMVVNNYETADAFISTMHSPSENEQLNWFRYFIQLKND